MPEALRKQWAHFRTHPTVEHCILTRTVTMLNANPSAPTPWIEPKALKPLGLLPYARERPNTERSRPNDRNGVVGGIGTRRLGQRALPKLAGTGAIKDLR